MLVIVIGLMPIITGALVTVFFSISDSRSLDLLRLVTLVSTLLILAVGLPTARHLGKPIVEISQLCAKIASGEIPSPVKISRADEFGQLSRSLQEIASFLAKAKTDLEKSKIYYHAIMEASNDAILVLDPNNRWHITEANLRSQKITGFSQSELLSKSVKNLFPTNEWPQLQRFYHKVKETGSASLDNLILQTKNGNQVWVETQASLVKHHNGQVVQQTIRDITEKKRKYILSEKEIAFIHELNRVLPLFQDLDKVIQKIIASLVDTLRFHAFSLVLMEERKALVWVSEKPRKRFISQVQGKVSAILKEMSDPASRADQDQIEFSVHHQAGIPSTNKFKIRSQMILPLAVGHGLIGLFSVNEDAFSKEDLSLFSTLVSGISSIYIAYKSYCQVQKLSVTDPLTNLINRRKFFEELEKEANRCRRYKHPLSLIMLDIDHFKKVNDTFGHQFGDKVLCHIAEILRTNTRRTDTVARYGGEEFIILLPETPLVGGGEVAERIRQATAKSVICDNLNNIAVTVSLGVTNFSLEDNIDSFVKRADQALYKAKDAGRNAVCIQENCSTNTRENHQII
jgi:diguanylate cyclase (GGDEF)-like protein/PAS domain S-box-containing protein